MVECCKRDEETVLPATPEILPENPIQEPRGVDLLNTPLARRRAIEFDLLWALGNHFHRNFIDNNFFTEEIGEDVTEDRFAIEKELLERLDEHFHTSRYSELIFSYTITSRDEGTGETRETVVRRFNHVDEEETDLAGIVFGDNSATNSVVVPEVVLQEEAEDPRPGRSRVHEYEAEYTTQDLGPDWVCGYCEGLGTNGTVNVRTGCAVRGHVSCVGCIAKWYRTQMQSHRYPDVPVSCPECRGEPREEYVTCLLWEADFEESNAAMYARSLEDDDDN